MRRNSPLNILLPVAAAHRLVSGRLASEGDYLASPPGSPVPSCPLRLGGRGSRRAVVPHPGCGSAGASPSQPEAVAVAEKVCQERKPAMDAPSEIVLEFLTALGATHRSLNQLAIALHARPEVVAVHKTFECWTYPANASP